MFVDTSAFIAMLAQEPAATELAIALGRARQIFTSGLVRLETCMRLASKLNIAVADAGEAFDALLDQANIEVMPIDDAISRQAVAAFATYGKGRGHKAQLNLADCMSYACAKSLDMPLLFIGDDFAQTDIAAALRLS